MIVSQPAVSIIIPAYDAAQWISDAIESCLRQKYEIFEVVIVDDGSTDETHSVSSRYANEGPKAVRIIRTINNGSSAARNVGLESAKGDYVLFLDADDILHNDALEVLSSIAMQTGADAVLGAHSNFEHSSGKESFIAKKILYRDSYANAARLRYVQGSFFLRNTSLRWNERRLIWEGMEYLLDFLASGRQAAYTDLAVVKVRQHQSQTRISSHYDHFEPAMTGAFFAEQKCKLIDSRRLNLERASALDLQILGNAYSLLKLGRGKEADFLFDKVSWGEVEKYDWYKIGSLAWAAKYCGRKLGSRSFYYINKALGRI